MNELQASLVSSGVSAPLDAVHSIEEAFAADAQAAATVEELKGALTALQEAHKLHCENITHLAVPGYKSRRRRAAPSLSDAAGRSIATPLDVQFNVHQGVPKLTGNDLDFAVEGRGFFEAERPDGSLCYRRNSAFRQDLSGRLVTAQGWPLTDQVVIPEASAGITALPDGQMLTLGADNHMTAIGTIHLHVVPNPAFLRPASR